MNKKMEQLDSVSRLYYWIPLLSVNTFISDKAVVTADVDVCIWTEIRLFLWRQMPVDVFGNLRESIVFAINSDRSSCIWISVEVLT